MQHNNINSYINLTWYKRNTQGKIYHQATKFHLSLHHNCSLLFQLWNVFPRYAWWNIEFYFTQWNFVKMPALELLPALHSKVFVAFLANKCCFFFLFRFLPVTLFSWVTILKIETLFLANDFSATATTCVRQAFQTLHAPTFLAEFFSVLSLQR